MKAEMDMEEKITFAREAAWKITISNLLNGKIISEGATFVFLLPSLEKMHRVNVVGTILRKERTGNITNLLADDGTGQAVVRFFELSPFLDTLMIGQTNLIIGKPRKYNQETYLAPEIIRKIDPAWLKVRKKELEGGASEIGPGEPDPPAFSAVQELIVEKITEEATEETFSPPQKLMQLIKELDCGEGVHLEELIERSPFNETSLLLEKMIEKGEIYYYRPGKVKVL